MKYSISDGSFSFHIISYQPKKETISSRLLRSKGLGEWSRINNLSRHSWQSLTNFETETMTIMKVTWQTESDTWTVFAITCNVLWFVWQYLILTIKDSLTNPKDLLNFCQIVLSLTFEFCRSGSPSTRRNTQRNRRAVANKRWHMGGSYIAKGTEGICCSGDDQTYLPLKHQDLLSVQ